MELSTHDWCIFLDVCLLQCQVYFKKYSPGVPVVAQQVKNPICIHEDVGVIPGLTQ